MAGRRRLGEFELIRKYFAPLAAKAPLAFGLTDDAAVIRPNPGQDLVVTTDCMVAGVHFLPADGAGNIARKLLRVNLSDLAAKGAVPTGYVLAAAFPEDIDENWIAAFARGLAADQARYAVPLLGGDTAATAGPMTLTVTAFGELPTDSMLRRAGAVPGDGLYVSGSVGDAVLGLAVKRGDLAGLAPADARALLDRLHLPEPRLALGARLRGIAHACLDVSDGLVQDLGHIAETSGVRCVIELDRIPLSAQARAVIARDSDRRLACISGGDDYELAFAAPAGAESRLAALAAELDLALTRIGWVEPGVGIEIRDETGRPVRLERGGYQHFRA